MITTISELTELQNHLKLMNKIPCPKQVFVGFDGFIDTIKSAVSQRQNYSTIYFKKMGDFANRVSAATGKSGQIEWVTQRVKLGGNAPILANTLGKFNVSGYCMGAMGYPEKNPVFSDMNKNFQLISVLNPGKSDAIEFEDGKIIFSELNVFKTYDWSYIKSIIGIDKLKTAILKCSVLAFVDWANLPHASNIWEGILNHVIKPSGLRNFIFFFDLCDPSKKTTEQIDEVLDLISSFSHYGKVVLGLNENETLKIWAAITGTNISMKNKIPCIADAADQIYKAMNIDYLLIHPIDSTVVFNNHDVLKREGRLVKEPKVLTGGGDNLNAGFCLGLLYNLSITQCMLLGMATSGYYVENGLPPDVEEIIGYIDLWKNGISKASAEHTHVFT